MLCAGCAVADPLAAQQSDQPTGVDTPGFSATPTPTPEPPPVPDPAKVEKALAKVPSDGVGVKSWTVLGPDGELLASSNDSALTPASTMKVLTAMAALDVIDPATRFETKVVSPKAGQLVLVGGGDACLMDKVEKKTNAVFKQATLKDLADQTVKVLKAAGLKKVSLGYDESLFAGSGWGAAWKANWRTSTPRVSALTVNTGMKTSWEAYTDPASATAQLFAARLKKAGIAVTSISAKKAKAGAGLVASVQSATLAEQVAYTLRYSYNLGAEVMLRQFGVAAGATPSFAGSSKALVKWLKQQAMWEKGMVIDGGSGLSPKAKVTSSALATAIDLSLTNERWASVVTGLPVAGKSGTLKSRFDDKAEKAGRNVVHAKTGTLKGLASLAGYVTTKDGAVLRFALIANDTPSQTTAYNWLDRAATALAKCGCR